ncbi:hypothetical protein L1N85_15240 [Paenibacillus alkaliterrae]|uniref:hypothetical protein n=1 Tax=Paenibacillus alkaliterrae TaxID=320909 RepID=UPI001F357B93|nr:hypothetical protein [Paenibacillus alkaliterrae]MCF2939774.1 hypothetical protein [Paenibacillus alkaliterrae]
MKKRRFFLILGLLIAVISTAVSFATESGTTTLGITASANSASVTLPSGTGQAAGKYNGEAPTWSPVVNSTGSITAGDLYIVNMVSAGVNKRLTLYLNNPDQLSKAYSYLNMKVTVYKANIAAAPTAWTPVAGGTSYLSLINGYISFDLTNGEKYAVSVDSGSYYNMKTSGVVLAPSFFAELR